MDLNKRSIVEVFDPEDGQAHSVSEYLQQGEKERFELRRQLRPIERERDLLCSTCYQHVYLAGEPSQSMFFKHLPYSEDCPLKSTTSLTEEQIRAMKYNGLKESAAHRENKKLLAALLESDGSFNDIRIEKTFREENETGIAKEWRRPDVSALHLANQTHIAFELQVTTTFIDTIIAREHFYQKAGAFILWVFLGFESKSFTELDIFYGNGMNAFIFDEEAKAASHKAGKLILKCIYREFQASENGRDVAVVEQDKFELVAVSELQFDSARGKLYFFDSAASHKQAERQVESIKKTKAEEARKAKEEEYRRRNPPPKNKGLNARLYNKLSAHNKLDKVFCPSCNNSERFRNSGPFVYCERCNQLIPDV